MGRQRWETVGRGVENLEALGRTSKWGHYGQEDKRGGRDMEAGVLETFA
jgi:hypothetical protein